MGGWTGSGCWSWGVGTDILLRRLGAAHVTAFDLDPAMVALARNHPLKAHPTAEIHA